MGKTIRFPGRRGVRSVDVVVGATLCALTLAVMAVVPRAAHSADLDLTGTWFVVMHYTDISSNNPEAKRWLDRVWTIQPEGSRLSWTEYPIVVVSDTSGRFEVIQGNPRSRVLAAWEPNRVQLQEIMEGPRINTRGSKTKSLRKARDGTWASKGSSAVRSATVVGYTETWQIDDPTNLPTFSILDSVGGGAALGTETGGSIYRVTEVLDDGNELRGAYQRDDIITGSFRMLRTLPIRGLKTAEDPRSPNQRAEERATQRWIEEAQKAEE